MLTLRTGEKLFSLKPNSYLTSYNTLTIQSHNLPIPCSRVTVTLMLETVNVNKDSVGRLANMLVNNTGYGFSQLKLLPDPVCLAV